MSLVGHRALLAALAAFVGFTNSIGLSFAASNGPASASGDYQKTLEMTMAVEDEGLRLGEAVVLGHTDGSIKIERESFLTAIRPAMRPEALRDLEAALPLASHFDPAEIASAGVPVHYDQDALKLIIELQIEQRPRGQVSGTLSSAAGPEASLAPADFSGFLNAHAGLAYEREEGLAGRLEYPAVLLEGGLRAGGVVLEASGQLDTNGNFARQATRLVYDLPENVLRISAGDLELNPAGSFVMPPILGVGIAKSYLDLQPTANIRPTGRRSFRIERPSEVVVLVNGVEARRLHLQAGEYDLDDLPLASGTNNVQLRLRDQFGKEEEINFAILHNRILLDSGISEWTIAAGLRANAGLLAPVYDEEAPVAIAEYRRGLHESITGSLSAQSSDSAALVGGSLLSQMTYGLLSLEAAFSGHRKVGPGWSLSGDLELESRQFGEAFNSANVGVEIIGRQFASAVHQEPSEGSRARVSASMGRRLGSGTSATLSGYYQFAEEELDHGFGASFSLSQVLRQDLSLALSGTFDERGSDRQEGPGTLSVFARLNFRPDRSSYAAIEYQHASHTASLTAGSNYNEGSSRTSLGATWEHTPKGDGKDQLTHASAELYHVNDRFEVNATHGRQFDRPASGTRIRRSAINIGMGLGIADGKAALGRPVRGGFAIIDTHESLNESVVEVDSYDHLYKAASDELGPLLVSDISAYTPTHMTYEVENLPTGYDVGSGIMTFLAPFKAGYSVQIGSDAPVTAVGRLLDLRGEPVTMKAGTASAADRQIVFFTNASGNFTVLGLKGGDWMLTLNDDPNTYRLRIPDDANGLVEVGDVRPHE
jgi:outer membrane usher protein